MSTFSNPVRVSATSSALRVVAVLGCTVAVLSGLALAASGFGYRWEWWGLGSAVRILRWSAYGGVAAGVLSMVVIVGVWLGAARDGTQIAFAGLLMSSVVAGIPWTERQRFRRAPPIHDITTDTVHPPAFSAVLPLRASAPNGAEYGGAEIAAQQLAAYPDIQPVLLPLAPAEAYQRALGLAIETGWTIVARDSGAGRIEATATSFWYGLKDDVVIRLTLGDGGTRVDVRSVSRVGQSDLGTNARRIRKYVRRLQS